MTNAKALRVVWAVDPLEHREFAYAAAIRALASLRERTRVEIVPVAVLATDELSLPAIEDVSPGMHLFRADLRDRLNRALQRSGVSRAIFPPIIVRGYLTRSLSVQRLLEVARKQRAELIVLNTHGRKGVRRAFLGSFAETLVLQSPVPALLAGPHAGSKRPFDRILFATDFSDTTGIAFKSILDLAAKLHSEIILFHALKTPEAAIQTWGLYDSGAYRSVKDLIAQKTEQKRAKAEAWAAKAAKIGVRIQVRFEETLLSTPQAVSRAAKKHHVGMVAMEAQSGPVEAALLGSATREVLRAALCPVFVIRTQNLAKARTRMRAA